MGRDLARLSKGAAASALLSACAWTSLDAVSASPDTFDAAVPDAFAAPDAIDGLMGTPASTGCNASTASGQEWTFDSTIEPWTFELDNGVQATPTWTGAFGDPDPGALQIDVAPNPNDASLTGGWLHVALPSTDLSSVTIYAWAWLESGEVPHLKTFVQTGTMYKWADNGTIYLAPHQWTCLSLPVSTPAYSQPQYDPTKVVSLGFEMLATAPFRLVFDTVRYH